MNNTKNILSQIKSSKFYLFFIVIHPELIEIVHNSTPKISRKLTDISKSGAPHILNSILFEKYRPRNFRIYQEVHVRRPTFLVTSK